ncbi:MFS transporter [Hwanghaeella sp.]|uniref:MFS transporter n=1 Tax=Hwanghaeella sp. TaxID=2605943 RepID=UPI003CCC1D13
MTMIAEDTGTDPRKATWWVIGGMTLIAPGSGLMATFTPTRLKLLDFSEGEVGMVVTGFSIGLLLGCFFAGPLVRRVGHIRALAFFCSLAGLSILAMSAEPSLPLWTVARVATGFSSTAIFVAAQSWLNEISPSDQRGRVMSIFYVLYIIGIGLGSLIMSRLNLDMATAFILGAGFYMTAIIPFAFTPAPTPPPPERAGIDLRAAFEISPLGVVASAAAGALTMSFYGIGPVYALLEGFDKEQVGLLMAAAPLGNIVLQLPMGLLSDKLDRRRVLVVAALVAGAAALMVGLLDLRATGGLVLVILAFMLLAGSMETLYSVGSAHANDHAAPGQHVSLAATLLLAWSVGAIAGPAVGSALLGNFQPGSLFLLFAGTAGSFVLYTLWRMTRRPTPPQEAQEDFVAVSATAPIQAHPEAYVEEMAEMMEEAEIAASEAQPKENDDSPR